MKTLFLSLVFFTFFCALSSGQVKHLREGEAPGRGTVSDIAWLSGYWTGSGLGGECEEIWSPVMDGHMIGTFRFFSEGKMVFSEFMHLIQEGDSFTLKLRHYNPDLSAWEEEGEWTDFPLVELGENIVWFDGLTIENLGEELLLSLAISEDGEWSIETLRYRKGEL
ncbi:DUF6265 family protein [Algoriphagus namhaensis]